MTACNHFSTQACPHSCVPSTHSCICLSVQEIVLFTHPFIRSYLHSIIDLSVCPFSHLSVCPYTIRSSFINSSMDRSSHPPTHPHAGLLLTPTRSLAHSLSPQSFARSFACSLARSLFCLLAQFVPFQLILSAEFTRLLEHLHAINLNRTGIAMQSSTSCCSWL